MIPQSTVPLSGPGSPWTRWREHRSKRETLFALAGYGGGRLWPGFIVALVAIPAMRYLAQRKIAIAEKLGSRALRADAITVRRVVD